MALRLEGQLSLDGSGWQRGLNNVKTATSGFVNNTLGGLKGQIAAAFSVGAIAGLSKKTIEFAGQISDMADRLGVSTDYLQQMDYHLKQNGSSASDLASVFERLAAARSDAMSGNQTAIGNFQSLGITQDQIASSAPEQILDAISRQFQTMGNSPELTAAFRQIGGRGASVLIPSFMEGLEQGRKNAVAAGAVISEDVLIQLDEIGDHFDQFKTVLVSTFAPALLKVMQFFEFVASQIRATFGAIHGFISNLNIPQLLVTALKGFASGGVVGAAKGVITSDNFKNAFNAASQNVASEDARYQAEIAATENRVAEKSRARAIARQSASIATGSDTIKQSVAKTESLGGGGFFGRNTASRTIEGIAQRQLNEAVLQRKATEKSEQWLKAIANEKGIKVPR